MKAEVDPRLIEQMNDAGDEGDVEALVLLADEAEPQSTARDGNRGQQLMQRVCREAQQQPKEIRYLPKLGALYVKGTRKLIKQLLDNDEVVAASANDTEITTS